MKNLVSLARIFIAAEVKSDRGVVYHEDYAAWIEWMRMRAEEFPEITVENNQTRQAAIKLVARGVPEDEIIAAAMLIFDAS